jgi:ABC-type transport system involved in multi-copper enzyme maturation permease subunit
MRRYAETAPVETDNFMSVLPIIVRELRAQARQPLTYWLRLAGGISLGCAIAFALWTMGTAQSGQAAGGWIARVGNPGPNPFQTFGTALFGKMNLFIFAAIWLFVPLAAADAISRERREGTLSLLYLTELHAFGIVLGKTFVHMLRSLSLFLTMAPWLLLPVLLGGVELRDIRMALLLDFASVLLAMAAGMAASTIPRDWLKAVILAELFAMALLGAMLYVHGVVLAHAVSAALPTGVTTGTRAFWNSSISYFGDLFPGNNHGGLIARTTRLIELTTNGSFHEPGYWFGGFGRARGLSSDWGQIWTSLTPAGQAIWFRGTLAMVVGAGLVLAGTTFLGAWHVARSWQDVPQQGPVSDLRRKLFAPCFGAPWLHRKLSRSLAANPIGWLQQYSPSARMVKWGWCLFIIVVEIIFSADCEDLYRAQAGLGLFLLLGLTFSATASFREELETGAFELLLVTPLRERQIIAGRVRGLWWQFLPAVLVYGAGSIYLASGWSYREYARQAWSALSSTISGYCALPLIGLYFSVRRWNFFVAWLAACLVGLLPGVLGRMLGLADPSLIALQLGPALISAVLLEKRLRSRGFLQHQS